MKTKSNFSSQLLAALIVPIGIILVLMPYAFLLGHNHILTVVPFWFVIVPVLASYLPTIVMVL